MSLKNWSTTAASNTALPPDGAPESSTKFKDWNDIMRQVMAKVRCLAAPVTIASAATTDLGASDETIQTISGTTTITSFGTVSAGIWKLVTFSGALTLTHNATSLILLTGANRTTVAGDCGLYVSLGGGNWKEYFYSAYGTSYQPLDTTLTALAGLTTSADNVTYSTGADTFAQTPLTAYARTLLDDADAATARTTLGAKSATLDNAFSAYATVDQTITANTNTKVTLGTEEFDLSNTFATSRFTPNVAGYYQLNFAIAGAAAAAGSVLIPSVYKNGVRFKDGTISRSPSAGTASGAGSCTVYLNGTTDYVELYIYMDGTTVYGGTNLTHFSGFRVG